MLFPLLKFLKFNSRPWISGISTFFHDYFCKNDRNSFFFEKSSWKKRNPLGLSKKNHYISFSKIIVGKGRISWNSSPALEFKEFPRKYKKTKERHTHTHAHITIEKIKQQTNNHNKKIKIWETYKLLKNMILEIYIYIKDETLNTNKSKHQRTDKEKRNETHDNKKMEKTINNNNKNTDNIWQTHTNKTHI